MTSRISTVLLAASLLACHPEIQRLPSTEVLVRIDASSEVRSSAKRLRLHASVQQKQAGAWVDRPSVTIDLDRPGPGSPWPVDVPVIPSDSSKLPALFQIVAEAIDERGERLVQDRALTSFVRESQLVLTLRLARCGDQPLGTACEHDPQCHGTECQRCDVAVCAKTAVTKPNALRTLEEANSSSPASDDGDGARPTNDAGPAGSHAAGAGGEGGRGGSSGNGKSGKGNVAGAAGMRNMAAGSGGAAGGGGEAGDQGSSPSGPKALTWSSPVLLESSAADAVVADVASNERGDTVVAWWQDATDGYIWMRRNLSGTWDSAPFRVAGDTKPESLDTVGLGIDLAGTAQLFYRGKNKSYWVRWSGEEKVMVESSPSPLQDAPPAVQDAAFPLGLGVDEKGRAIALWSNFVEGPATSAVYKNYFDMNKWGMPDALNSVSVPAELFSGPWESFSNASGTLLTVTMTADPRQAPLFAGELSTFISFGSGVSGPATLKPSQPMANESFDIDELSNATALLATGTEADNTHVYWSRLALDAKNWSTLELFHPDPISAFTLTHVSYEPPLAFWLARSASNNPKRGHLNTSHYLATGGWSAPETLSADFNLYQDIIEAGTNAAGKVVVAWVQTPAMGDGAQGNSLMYVQYIPSRGWSKPMSAWVADKDISLDAVTVREDGRVLLIFTTAALGSSIHDLHAIAGQ